ncbi:MAG: endonuclease/exonuclease/phosphatase family protein [Armatimonadota bacterium]
MRVMTFNLKFATPKPPNSWSQRRPVTAELIQMVAPDIFGTQEGLYAQIRDIQSDCSEYDWVGLGREGGSRSEFCAIFYLRDRFEPLEFDHFWLSDTPDVVGSRTWGHWNTRMATWVKFRDRHMGSEFYCLNTHLDHESQTAKEKGARLILDRMDIWFDPALPIIMTGDFNAIAMKDPVYGIFMEHGGFSDTWYTAKEHIGPDYATFHDYKGPELNGPHIDWILTRGSVDAESTGVVVFEVDGQYPSDHCPVVCTLSINGRK